MNVIRHDTEDRLLWTYLDTTADKLTWHVKDEEPVLRGKDADGHYFVDLKVKESFTDAGDLLKAQRENGFHSWKEGRSVAWTPKGGIRPA